MKQMSEHNVEAAELAKFARLAETWWDKNGSCKPLHVINIPRVEFILQTFKANNETFAGKTVLDVGCGGGILTEALCVSGAKVTGLDAEAAVIHAAKLHAQQQNLAIEYVVNTLETFKAQQPQAQYDCVTCMELLEHVPDPGMLVQTLVSMVKPGGKLFISTINRNLTAYCLAIIAAEYVLKLLPQNTHEYAKFITPAELTAWLRAGGATVAAIRGISYNPVTNYASLINSPKVNYILYATV